MKFSRIIINNFRQYKEENVIDLTSTKLKPINIIVGENGSGKSNFFKAINWCLYGDIGKNSSKTSQINHSLLNESKVGDKLEMSVILELIDSDGNNLIFTKKEISIKKTNMKGKNKAKAFIDDVQFKVEYWDDGHQFKSTEFEYTNFVNRTLPYELSKFFFIDGDDLLNTIKKIKQNDIKNHFHSLTKITDAQQVLRNLNNWKSRIKQTNLSRSKSADVEVFRKLKNEAYKTWQDKEDIVKVLDDEIKDIDKKISLLKPQIEAFKQGKEFRDKRDYLNTILALEQKKLDDLIENRRRNVIENLPGILLEDATLNFTSLVHQERKDDKLPPPLIENIDVIKQLLNKEDNLTIGEQEVGSISWKNSYDRSKFLKNLKKYNKSIENRIDSDFLDRATQGEAIIKSHLVIDKNLTIETAEKSFKDGKKLEDKIKKLKDERDEISEKLKGALPAEEKKIEGIYERHLQDYQRRVSDKIGAEAIIKISKEAFHKEDRNLSNMENYAQVGKSNEQKISDIEQAIEILNTSIGLLSATAVNDINEILNKVLSRSDIKKDFKTANIYQDFAIEVLNTANNNLLDEDDGGSNGQKLNIAFSYMYAMKLGTGIDFPILIDSPYGKLGMKYRETISKNFISNTQDDLQVTFLFHGEEYSEIVKKTFKDKESNKVCIRVAEKDKLDIVSSYISSPEKFENDLKIINEG